MANKSDEELMKKNKIKKIGIIGHFGGNKDFFDGQTIKTKILYDELKKATDWKIKKVDTFYNTKNKLKLLWQTFKCLFSTKHIIVLLSGNGMKTYFPILYFFSKIFRTKVYHDVIGGDLQIMINKYLKFKKYLNSFKVNWVETQNLKKRLSNLGITTVEVLPNFKNLPIVDEGEIKKEYDTTFKFCTFSRVMKEKGIEDAINVVEKINIESNREVCSLDIYGVIDKGYEKRFDDIMKNASASINYKGAVPFNKSVDTIKGYYALLFPSYWSGEGFAGTIVDAFSAGLPVIASDWNCNKEIVVNKKTGILYPNDEQATLYDSVKWMIDNSEQVFEMKKNCVKEAKKYLPAQHIEKIIAKMEQ